MRLVHHYEVLAVFIEAVPRLQNYVERQVVCLPYHLLHEWNAYGQSFGAPRLGDPQLAPLLLFLLYSLRIFSNWPLKFAAADGSSVPDSHHHVRFLFLFVAVHSRVLADSELGLVLSLHKLLNLRTIKFDCCDRHVKGP